MTPYNEMQLYTREACRRLQYRMTKRYFDNIHKIIINNNNQ